ncbi:TetR/AcrR family transcriptional regulator [Microtetraspora sp. AC03309]|uniref:TetR/AcrR family transcriptional regulator n=1 Tax=Microtetraspora sp. AC03309 TaxID=2779376 RepID=UPI001E529E2B|nr:TetR/AcrR family transcriptional regulator [Microtetraspora sp. AC03309]MCC5579961.1 TetR/AcrR family transcriptional regulator [Microtetraspora sp. AC03309]
MPATPKGRRTEAAFLDAARQVFAEKGYFNAKISDIAQAAGKSPGSFYNYYENKEELLEALLEQFSIEVLEASFKSQSDDPLESIRGAVRAYWTTYRKYLAEMVGVFQMSMTDAAFAERWRENRAAGIRTVLAGIKNAEKAGHHVELDPGTLASAIVSMLESFCWVWMAAGGDANVNAPDDETAIETLSALWYRTIYFVPPSPA